MNIIIIKKKLIIIYMKKIFRNRIKFLNVLIRNKIWNVENESPIDYVYQKISIK